MKSLAPILCLSVISSLSYASDLEGLRERKLLEDYGPIEKVCSEEAQDTLGGFVSLDDSRCSGLPVKLCFSTTQFPIGDYVMSFEGGICEVRVVGTSIRKYHNTVTCEDIQGRALCGGQYEWAKPSKSILPKFNF